MSVLNILGWFLIGIEEIFPMQSSRFTKSLCFGRNWKKVYFYTKIELNPIDSNKLFSMKSSEFEIFHSIKC